MRMLVALASIFALVSHRCELFADPPAKPATLAEIRDSIDWSKLPTLDGAVRVRRELAMMSYSAPGTPAQVADLYRKALGQLGWTDAKITVPGGDTDKYLFLGFDFGKNGFHVTVYASRSEPDGLLSVILQQAGNVDVRRLPRMPDAKVKTDFRTNCTYTTAAKPEAVAEMMRKEMAAQGWREVPALAAKMHAKEGRTVLRFVQNGMECGTTITVNIDGTTEVPLYPHVRNTFEPADVAAVFCLQPAPKPATTGESIAVIDLRKFPRMNGGAKLPREKELLALSNLLGYEAPGTIADGADFHRKKLAELGWTETGPDMETDSSVRLNFEKAGYLVSFGAVNGEQAGRVKISLTNSGNVDLRQMPYPPGAEIHWGRDDFANATTTVTVEAANAFYRSELPRLGWKESAGRRGKGTLKYSQNDVDLMIEIGKNVYDETSVKLRTVLQGVP